MLVNDENSMRATQRMKERLPIQWLNSERSTGERDDGAREIPLASKSKREVRFLHG
ncbi:hypothetical protein NC653_004952 [Populus alba x Populus x berolinensis]|uniref:Uncharacterized protein n=1 Tax=Populus alba x Populus x berolinensis TaxID=444605 RepID=A0AAD6RAU7_9ROSI|nr:hypothetical protein NC653_004952 [Populus alba x Populus x berolinensis]